MMNAVLRKDRQFLSTESMTSELKLDAVYFQGASNRDLLSNVSLSIQPGEKIAIVGPNGAGKSTLQKILSGRLTPDRGDVIFQGQPMSGIARHKRAQAIAVMAQSEHIAPLLTVREYVALGRIPHQLSESASRHEEAVEHALVVCGIKAFEKRTIQTLSGGEKQRASLARALAQDPTLLLLDEPTNHLDLRARSDLLRLVSRLDSTVVSVLHDLSLVAGFADRVIVIADGQIVADGPPDHSLSSDIVDTVFSMNVVDLTHSPTGKSFRVFEAPDI